MFDTINDIVQYKTIGGKTILKHSVTIKRKNDYKSQATKDIESWGRKVTQFHNLCRDLGINQVSLRAVH